MMTERFTDAFALANRLHAAQTRKGSAIPYISHLMAVSALVLEHGGDEDQAIAGLLHDAVEDQGGMATAQIIERQFGRRVTEIVLACTDAAPAPGQAKLPWRLRKEAYLERLDRLPADAALIMACDKIHNLRCTIADIDRDGLAALTRFDSPTELGWYFSGVAAGLQPFAGTAPVARLDDLARQFSILVASFEAYADVADA